MKVHLKVALASDAGEEFCGPGVLQLLDGIGRHGSIRQAAADMGLSYVKALKILNRLERELGQALLVRHKGGAERGRTELTPRAHTFMTDCLLLRAQLERAAGRAFEGFRRRQDRFPARRNP